MSCHALQILLLDDEIQNQNWFDCELCLKIRNVDVIEYYLIYSHLHLVVVTDPLYSLLHLQLSPTLHILKFSLTMSGTGSSKSSGFVHSSPFPACFRHKLPLKAINKMPKIGKRIIKFEDFDNTILFGI